MPARIALPKKENPIKKIVKVLWYWTPVLIWMGIIFTSSCVKGDDIPKFDVPNIDKLFHTIEYFILGALLVRAFSNSITSPKYLWIFIASVLIASCYGASDEFHQLFTSGRSCDIFDLLFDAIGSSAGAGLYVYRERIGHAVDKAV